MFTIDCKDIILREFRLEDLNAMALTHNTASNRVIQKCGFRYLNDINIGDRHFHYYKLNRNEL